MNQNEQKPALTLNHSVIIYRLKEEDGDKPDVRKAKDKTFFTELCGKVLGVEVRDQDVGKIFRLGKMTPGRDRPLLIGLKSESMKNEIMSNLNKLKDTDDRFKKVATCRRSSVRRSERHWSRQDGIRTSAADRRKPEVQSGRAGIQAQGHQSGQNLTEKLSCLYLNARSCGA